MSRPLRVDFPGAWHHVMHRGARRAPVFLVPEHCLLFLEIVGEAVSTYGLEVHAYSLMPNHYHLLVRSPLGTLSRAMQHVNGAYTKRLNGLHSWDGPVFRGRFASQLVELDEHLEHLIAYLHLNPVRAHLAARPADECWTSHRAYLGLEKAPAWLTTSELLGRFGDAETLHRYVLDWQQGSEKGREGFDLETGWIAEGGEALAGLGSVEPSDRAQEEPVAPATILAHVVRVTGCSLGDLTRHQRGPGANPARRFAVWALRYDARFTFREIGLQVDMRAPQVAKVLERIERAPGKVLLEWMKAWRLSTRALVGSPLYVKW